MADPTYNPGRVRVGLTGALGMFTYICNSGNASLYPDFSAEQFQQFIQLLQEDTGIPP